MPPDISNTIAAVMSPPEAARHIGLAVATLAKMRSWGGGPPFLKLGRVVRYERRACDEWLETRRVNNTSESRNVPRRLTDAR